MDILSKGIINKFEASGREEKDWRKVRQDRALEAATHANPRGRVGILICSLLADTSNTLIVSAPQLCLIS